MKTTMWAVLALAGLAGASPITFTISTSGSGNFNGTAFGDNTLTITYVSDTLNILAGNPLLTPDPSATVMISVAGVGSGTINGSTEFYVNQTTGVAGVNDASVGNLLEESDPAVFDTYNMKTALGPISAPISGGTGSFTEQTSNGQLVFTTNSTNASFQAQTSSTPEPGSLGLMLAGAITLAALRKRVK